MLQQWLATVNAFVEDTCVIFAVAYLLTRGKKLVQIFQPRTRRDSVSVGLLFGVLAATEAIFPDMRAPYVSHTLVVCLAMFVGGWIPSLVATAVVIVVELVLHGGPVACQTLYLLLVTAGISRLCSLSTKGSAALPIVAATGMVTQGIALVLADWVFPKIGMPALLYYSPASIPANGAGLFLVMLVLRDSNARALAQEHRLDLERAKAMSIASELAALRARIRPHFLFNTLTALASLCSVDAERAEQSIIKLSRLMRRTLEADPTPVTSLSAEVDYVRSYTDLQTLRFGGAIKAVFKIDAKAKSAELPAFGLQTLVENAYQHGFERWSRTGEVRIVGRPGRGYTIFAVQDNGKGMNEEELARSIDRAEMPRHGMGMIDRQLRLTFGPRSKLRIFSAPGYGTLVAFRIPNNQITETLKHESNRNRRRTAGPVLLKAATDRPRRRGGS